MFQRVKQIIFEVYCIFCVVGIPFSVRYGFLYWCLQTLFGYLSVFIDWKLFPYAEKNLQELERHGYSRAYVAAVMLLNLLLTNTLVALVYSSVKVTTISRGTLPLVLINLAITEVMFTSAHGLLHNTQVGSKLHTMHHCCKCSSWSTNLVFHPLDMAAEFSGPVLSVIGMHLLWKDEAALAITVVIVHLWYALDHSAFLQLPHTKHHAYIDNMYSIYVKKHLQLGSKDLVKPRINKKKI